MTESKAKELKIWNGHYNRSGHLYICGKNRKHAAELMMGCSLTLSNYDDKTKERLRNDELQLGRNYREITTYFNEGSWGYKMEELVPIPEIGVWYQEKDKAEIKRII